MKHLGNGEGFTTLVLTDAESRLIRKMLAPAPGEDDELPESELSDPMRATMAYNRGIQRATERIKAEFDAEQKARKNR